MGILYEETPAIQQVIRTQGHRDATLRPGNIQLVGTNEEIEERVAGILIVLLADTGRPRRADFHIYTRDPLVYALRIADVGKVPPDEWWNFHGLPVP